MFSKGPFFTIVVPCARVSACARGQVRRQVSGCVCVRAWASAQAGELVRVALNLGY